MVEYVYPLLDVNWDIHWLRPKIYYECGFFPDWITFIPPEAFVGFNKELEKEQKEALDKAMEKKDLGLAPDLTTVKAVYSTTINPEELTKSIQTSTGKKILYHCINGKVDLYFFDSLGPTDKTALSGALSGMWKET